MNEREARIRRIRGVYDEYRAASVSVGLLEASLRANPTFLRAHGLRERDARRLRDNLETTYYVRLFAEFEAGLRRAWSISFGKVTEPLVRDVIAAIAARRAIPQEWTDLVHRVRERRNNLVHDGGVSGEPIPILESQEGLCRFMSRLPNY